MRAALGIMLIVVGVGNEIAEYPSSNDERSFSIMFILFGLWMIRVRDDQHHPSLGIGGWLSVSLGLLYGALGAEAILGSPEEEVPAWLAALAALGGLFAVGLIGRSIATHRRRARQEEAEYARTASPQSGGADRVSLRGSLVFRKRFSVTVEDDALEIRVGMLFGRKVWRLARDQITVWPYQDIFEEFGAQYGPGWYDPEMDDDDDEDWDIDEELARTILPTVHLVTTNRPPAPTVQIDFRWPMESPKVNWFTSWLGESFFTHYCLPSRRLFAGGMLLSERSPGQLLAALRSRGWEVGEPPIVDRRIDVVLRAHDQSDASRLQSWSSGLAWTAVFLAVSTFVLPFALHSLVPERETLVGMILVFGFAMTGFSGISSRVLRRRFWQALAGRFDAARSV